MKNEKIINEIVKDINNLSGKHSSFEIFSDWVTMNAIAIQNACCLYHNDIWQKREDEFKDIKKKYTEKEIKVIFNLYGKLLDAYKKKMGQCFTPFSVSLLNAKITLKDVKEEKPFSLYEPTCGAGGMIISTAKELFDSGINYQNCMKVVAQDLNILCVYMTYIQLSLMGIDAIVVQGDTLSEPYIENYPTERVFRTPKNLKLS